MTSQEKSTLPRIALIHPELGYAEDLVARFSNKYDIAIFKNGFTFFEWLKPTEKFDLLLCYGNINGPNTAGLLMQLKASHMLEGVPMAVVVDKITPAIRREALEVGFTEIFDKRTTDDDFAPFGYLVANPPGVSIKADKLPLVPEYSMPWNKRLFDIFFSSLALLLLSPLFLVIAIAIRLESKGPVFYYSLRVGTGYNIFRFYKFRSMYTNADARLKELKHLNQYQQKKADEALAENGRAVNTDPAGVLLYADNKVMTEDEYKSYRVQKDGSTFIKIKDDPRVTKIGKFIRNTSIDELPQLWNVLKGDMSIVGNRPLPLYEAEKLTTDRFALRFMAPAGITGLWQVTKRGKKGEMSEEERIGLDNDYARNYSLWFDIKLIAKTIPALFQKENV